MPVSFQLLLVTKSLAQSAIRLSELESWVTRGTRNQSNMNLQIMCCPFPFFSLLHLYLYIRERTQLREGSRRRPYKKCHSLLTFSLPKRETTPSRTACFSNDALSWSLYTLFLFLWNLPRLAQKTKKGRSQTERVRWSHQLSNPFSFLWFIDVYPFLSFKPIFVVIESSFQFCSKLTTSWGVPFP